MKLSIFQVLSHKLKQLLWILESVACVKNKVLNMKNSAQYTLFNTKKID